MARPGITYDEVVSAIHKIIGSGGEPTINGIREHLGTGSPNTIHRHLTAWRQARPVEQRKAPELPAELQAALVKEIERQAAEERAEVEKALVSSQKEAETLSKSGEELEEANAVLMEQNTELAAEKERLTALTDERHSENEGLRIELERERKAAEEARILAAQGRNKIDTLEGQIVELGGKLTEALADSKAAQTAQVAAEKAAAVAEAKLEAERTTVADLRERLSSAQEQIKTEAGHHARVLSDAQAQAKATNDELMAALKINAELERMMSETKAKNVQFEVELDKLKKSPKTKMQKVTEDDKVEG